MSELGQNRKSSMRAYVFRCSPNNGHRQDTSACPFRANNARRLETSGSRCPHSITSSARASSEGGIVTPTAFAVFKLTASQKLVGNSIGKSPGAVPRRILVTKQTAAGEPGSDCREQAPGPDPGLHRRAAKEARHVPFGQGAAATWPEESYVQGRIDGTPGRRVARSGSFTRRPPVAQGTTTTHTKRADLP